MTDYEQALTVAIKALSELIEDNRKLRATIETLRGSKDCTSSNQSKPLYGISLNVLADKINSAYSEYVGPTISATNILKIAQYVSDHANEFIIL